MNGQTAITAFAAVLGLLSLSGCLTKATADPAPALNSAPVNERNDASLDPITPAVPARAEGPDPGLTLIKQRCTGCHGTEQIFSQRKTPEKWADTVEEMITLGSDLNSAEEAEVSRYLAENYAAPAHN